MPAVAIGKMSILVVKIVMLATMGVFALLFGLLPTKVCHLLTLQNSQQMSIT